MQKKILIAQVKSFRIAVLHSYSMVFFSKNKLFAVLILLVSFFNPVSGLAGLVSTLTAITAACLLGYDTHQVKSGLYTYSALLLGLGMGAFYETGAGFWILLCLASLLSLLISIALIAKLSKNQLPALSLAFIISFWLAILAGKEFLSIGLTQRHIYWINEMYGAGGSRLLYFVQQIENLPLPVYAAGFLRSMSAIIFQENIAAGILLSAGVLLNSRIAFVLMVLGYAAAIFFNYVMGGFSTTGVNYYNLGTNFMLVGVAIGGFYLIPSWRSYLSAIVMVPVSYVLVTGLGKITYTWGLPVFSLPFCVVVILFLYCMRLRTKANNLVVTPTQYYHPETNLYRYINGKERLGSWYYYQLFLPFMGEWMVSQGYNGNMTHKGEWSKALDFVILDSEMKTYKAPGNRLEDFYCYNKPVVSPADGVVEEISDYVDDNEIGKNNTAQNWGNSIVIKHAEGLYTKLSHLRKNSFKVAKGSYVKRGDIVALCGNSGRSPEPHLHFQVQGTSYIGSKTISYPLAYYTTRSGQGQRFKNFSIPAEGMFATNVLPNAQLQQAFNFQPGYMLTVSAADFDEEKWEVMTSVYNESYLYCSSINASAYFVNDGSMFYFTNFFGKKNSLLYYFYLAAYKVMLGTDMPVTITDTYPLNTFRPHPLRWLQDIVSPFFIFMKMTYQNTILQNDGLLSSGKISFESRQFKNIFLKKNENIKADINVEGGQLKSFNIYLPAKTIKVTCKA